MLDRVLLAGIILYNPNIQRLAENLTAICSQTRQVYLFNNGSSNIGEIKDLIRNYQNVILFNNNDNAGIAFALNRLINKAKNDGYKWVVTLDQDSVAPPNLVAEYSKNINTPNLGMICCKIIDRNFGERKYEKSHTKGIEDVDLCITSASAIKIEAWEKVGGFCEKMFIDAVDFDMCFSLKENGYRILRVNNVRLLHEVGHSRKVTFLGREELVFNHNPLRCYYMIRNSFLLGKRHHQLWRQIGLVFKRIILVNVYEKNRWNKNKMMLKGIFHAIIGKYGKYRN